MRRSLLAVVILALASIPAIASAEKANLSGVEAAFSDFSRLAPADLDAMRTAFCGYYEKTRGRGPLARDYFDYIEEFTRVIDHVATLRAGLALYAACSEENASKADAALLDLAKSHAELLNVIAKKAALSVKEFEQAGDFALGEPGYEAFRRIEFAARAAAELRDRLAEKTGQ